MFLVIVLVWNTYITIYMRIYIGKNMYIYITICIMLQQKRKQNSYGTQNILKHYENVNIETDHLEFATVEMHDTARYALHFINYAI